MKKVAAHIFVLASLFICKNGYCSGSKELFGKYPNKYFIESGTCWGKGVQMALDAGFERIYSIELAPHLFAHASEHFAHTPAVTILEGDSGKVLPLILTKIDAPATFWLDGHYSGEGTAKGESNSPILNELEAIGRHPIKTHTILIDDVRCIGDDVFDFVTKETIVQKILEINPNYAFFYEDGYCKNDVLVAVILD